MRCIQGPCRVDPCPDRVPLEGPGATLIVANGEASEPVQVEFDTPGTVVLTGLEFDTAPVPKLVSADDDTGEVFFNTCC